MADDRSPPHPSAGTSPAPADILFLTRAAIDAPALCAAVTDPGTGAVGLFLGTVRADPIDGRTVLALEYEAYEEMALSQLRRIVQQARQRGPVRRVAVVHRLGRVAVGEASVAVAVGTGHRGECFDACRWIIDTLKVEVPIWKREVFADGAARWVMPDGTSP